MAHLRGAPESAGFACQNCNCKLVMTLLTELIDGDHNDADNETITKSICCECLGVTNLVSHVSSFKCEWMEFHQKAGNPSLRGVLSRDIVCRHGQGKTCTDIHLYWIRFPWFIGLSALK